MVDSPEIVVTARKRPATAAGGTHTYRPRITITLRKNIARQTAGSDVAVSQRFKELKRDVDLTPYLGQGGTVVVTNSVREPAGMFSISIPDQAVPDQLESIYGLVEPLDIIEIRAAREASTAQAPLLMRGFVGEVRRDIGMTSQGAIRHVMISGHNYGKVLQLMRVFYTPGMVVGQQLLTAFKLAVNYGVDAVPDQPAADFVKSVVDGVVTPFLDKMRETASPGASSPIQHLNLDASVTAGTVSPFGAQGWDGGSIHDLLAYFGDVGAWNELYVEDRDDGPYLVYRPTPFRSVDGVMIQEGAKADTVDVFDSDITKLTVGRSDADVANYFWVDAPRFNLVGAPILRQAGQEGALKPDPFLKDYPNSSPDLYGVRQMQTATQQGARYDGQKSAEVDSGEGAATALVGEKRRILIEGNKDNVVLERGSMTLKGSELVRAGCYVRLTRGGTDSASGLISEQYAHTVTHEFAPMAGAWMTTVQFDRGTGFVERLQRGRGINSPYLLESSRKGAYGQ